MKKNTDFVEYLEKALKEKWGYCWGAWGRVLDDAYYKQVMTNDVNLRNVNYLSKQRGKRVADCYGILEGYIYADEQGNPPKALKVDRNTAMAYNAAKEKGFLSNMPLVPGIVLYMPGHVGFYIGNGRFIECAGGVGVVEGRIDLNTRKVTKGSKFTKWFKDTYLDYSVAPAPKPTPVPVPKPAVNVGQLKVFVADGNNINQRTVKTILHEGYNYVQLRDIAETLDYNVSVLEGQVFLNKKK